MFFPLFIPFGGIIELMSSLTVFGDGFAFISIRKLVIDLPTEPNILSRAFVTQYDLKGDLTSFWTSFLELTFHHFIPACSWDFLLVAL